MAELPGGKEMGDEGCISAVAKMNAINGWVNTRTQLCRLTEVVSFHLFFVKYT